MRLTSIETTPNPNSMKLNLDESVGKAVTYTSDQRAGCPQAVEKILDIEGVKSIYLCNDFITLNRDPRADWKVLLAEVSSIFGDIQSTTREVEEQRKVAEKVGQVEVLVQTFRGIPIQVKAVETQGEKRIALAARFSDAAQRVQARSGADYLKERYWADWGVRYGSLEEVAAEVVEEIEGSLNEEKVLTLEAKALGQSAAEAAPTSIEEAKADLASSDWHTRFQAVQKLSTEDGAIPLLITALEDSNQQVRRLVAAALGASGSAEAVGRLSEVLLTDASVGVRRTAGDALSDLGHVSAQSAMCRALSDPNKLVRWRAARFLADIGTEEALPFLKQAKDDSEFEVRLEIQAAIERIAGGKEESTPMWKKILKSGE
jgi:Virulence factor/Scaffold protein Nfu/NifU N terminal/HEAT repeats